MRYLIPLILLVSSLAHADGVISVGVGKGIMGEHGSHFERVVAAGYQVNYRGYFLRPEAGYFLDISGEGKSSYWLTPAMIGVKAVSSVGPELHIGVGPSYLSQPDQVLGGHFQFSLEAGMALVDENFSLGLVYKHLSSAGFNMPNRGRDFITVQLRVLAL